MSRQWGDGAVGDDQAKISLCRAPNAVAGGALAEPDEDESAGRFRHAVAAPEDDERGRGRRGAPDADLATLRGVLGGFEPDADGAPGVGFGGVAVVR